jgi:integrase
MIKTKYEGIYCRPDRAGRKIYYVRMRTGAGGRTRLRAGAKISQALALQQKLRAAKLESSLRVIRPQKVRFAEIAASYVAHYQAKAKPRTWDRVKSIFRTLARHFGGMLLMEIGPREIEQYVQRRRDSGRVHRCINSELIYLNAALNMAVEWGYLRQAPRIKMLPTPDRRARILSKEELETILAQASDDHSAAIRIALDTGLRLGELFRIRREDIDREAMMLHVPETKSGRPRDVPLTPRALELTLKQLLKHRGRMFREKTEGYLVVTFTTERKKKIKGVAPWRFHDLRHNFATSMLRLGVDPYTLLKLMGHSKMRTLEIYLHTDQSRMREAIALLARAQIGPVAPKGNGPSR